MSRIIRMGIPRCALPWIQTIARQTEREYYDVRYYEVYMRARKSEREYYDARYLEAKRLLDKPNGNITMRATTKSI